MARYKLTIEYDGGPYVGWQRQANGPSIQAAVEQAIRSFCQQTVALTCAGRTDAGVHAIGQVAHVDLVGDPHPDTVRDAVNAHLRPQPIAIVAAQEVPSAFDARRSAVRRSYRYRILNRRAPPALDAGRVDWVVRPLDHGAMHDAAQVFVGQHDFTSFRAKECQARSPARTLERLAVDRIGSEIHVTAAARSFLHHQIRNFVGTLKWVGEGRWAAADVCAALEARDRAAAGPTAPAAGLTFLCVDYPPLES